MHGCTSGEHAVVETIVSAGCTQVMMGTMEEMEEALQQSEADLARAQIAAKPAPAPLPQPDAVCHTCTCRKG